MNAEKKITHSHPQAILAQSPETVPLVYMVDDDTEHAEGLAVKIRNAGYRVLILDSIEALRLEMQTHKPDIIIVDMMLAIGPIAETIFRYARDLHIPVVFLSVRSDTGSRLAAVRAGATHYFFKPAEPSRIIAKLNSLTSKQGMDRYHIVLVDDDIATSMFYAHHLRAVGMYVTIFNKPVQAFEQLEACQADLIMLDVEMPGITGLELAALIRQMDKYNHVPIVFLSGDKSIQARLAGMHLGADDYLHKPVDATFMVKSIKARAARARTLRDGHIGLQRAMRDLEFMRAALDEHALVSLTDVDGRILYANQKFAEVSGYTLRELLGRNHRIVKSGLHSASIYEEMWSTIASGRVWHGTLSNRTKNGNLYDVSTTIFPKLDEAGLPQQYLSIRTEVTAIKSLKNSLVMEAERLSLALEATDSGMWEWNITSGQVIMSASWVRMTSYTSDVALSWPDLIHPEDFSAVFATLMRHIDGDTSSYESEHRLRNAKGNWDWVRVVGKIVERDAEGWAARIVGTTQIINERVSLKQQEQILQKRLVQAAKMESIGQLTAGIAHDFNNLLGGVLGYTELGTELLARNQGSDKLKNYLAQISAAGNRAKELISQMLVFSRLSPDIESDKAPIILLKPIVKEVAHLLRSSIPSNIRVNYHIEDEALCAEIQPVQLHQILLNLAINARDAIEEYGQIDISAARRNLSGFCDACHESFGGDYVEISVSDTGNGIPDHLLSKIFDPFFTTKEVGKGTGMGLSVVHGILHALGGDITVESEQGKGTTIRILLRAVDKSEIETAAPELGGINDSLAGLNIMVVDDEHAMVSMLHEFLTMHGAEVTACNLPLDALATFERNPDSFDMIITDETMPLISGLDLAKAMLKLRPDLPIILCTGYSAHVNADIAAQNGIAGFMHKPFDIACLIVQVKELTGLQAEFSVEEKTSP